MSKNGNNKPVSEIRLLLFENGDVDMSYSSNINLSDRIKILSQALERETQQYKVLMSMDDNRHLPC